MKEPTYLLSETEADNIIAYTRTTESRAEAAEKGLEKIAGIAMSLQKQIDDINMELDAVPDKIDAAVNKAYKQGYRKGLTDGGLLGFVIGAVLTNQLIN